MLGQPFDFWAKLEQNSKGHAIAWHPLFCHCADVAMCVKTILKSSIIGKRIAHQCGNSSLSPQQIDRLAVLAALHDFGKTNHGFQAKADNQAIRTAGHVFEAQSALLGTHHKFSERLVAALDLEVMLDWFLNEESLVSFMRVLLAHHGKPVRSSVVDPSLWQKNSNRDPIEGVIRLTSYTQQWFPLAWQPGGDRLPACVELQHAFAGLLMLCDWIGSDTTFFPFAHQWPDSEYHQEALKQATCAIKSLGIDSENFRRSMWLDDDPFKTIFSPFTPRAAQRACLNLPVEKGPSITVLEAETGAGKTEAAITRFASLFAASEVDG